MARIVPANDETLQEAAAIIRGGGVVAFPTETVYGLGANALDGDAVARIFAAKGRPTTNPVIVHIADPAQLPQVAMASPHASKLAHEFWPGPLTLVLPKRPYVPDIVTAGGTTVGVRMPRHPLALALIRASRVPIAAPSANRSEHISPTRAEHVADSLGDNVDLILDGGSCDVGLESTVLDISGETPRILRPGMIGLEELERVLRCKVASADDIILNADDDEPSKSPGQMIRHYAPKTHLEIYPARIIWSMLRSRNVHYAYLLHTHPPSFVEIQGLPHVMLPNDPDGYAAGLYDALHRLDNITHHHITSIVVEEVSDHRSWEAIRDRLNRASAAP